jgi:hypothetical protein
MSQDRLDRALREMQDEAVEPSTLEAVRTRVWNKLPNAVLAGCAEFLPDFPAYVAGTVTGGRRVLLEDHVSRCAACRTTLAEMRGERRVIAMPQRSSSQWSRWGSLAAAAALVLSVLYLGRDTLDAWMAPGGPRATVVSTVCPEGGSNPAPRSAKRNGFARALARTRRCASPTDRRWTSTSEPSCS